MPRSTLAIQEAPLVDAQGKLIGINTAIAGRAAVRALALQFRQPRGQGIPGPHREFGEVQRAFLGVHIRPVDEGLARDLGLPDVSGVMVTGLTKEGLPKPACGGVSSSAVDGAPPRPCLCS